MAKVVMIRNANSFDFGGAERIPILIAGELEMHGFDTIILSGSKKMLGYAKSQNINHKKSWWWSKQNWSGQRVVLVPVYIVWQLVLFFYYIVTFLRLRPGVVSLQSKDDFIAGTLAARVLGVRSFWMDHGDLKAVWMNHGVWYKNPVGKLVYLASFFTSDILTASKSELKLVEEQIPGGHALSKFRVIPNGTFDEHHEQPKSIDFISTGRLVTDKGIGELITAFKRLVAIHPTATLAIVGSGPEAKKFKKMAEGVPGITFHGHQTNPLDFLEKSKIFVLPTHHEAFGVAVVEAAMEGLAIVASDIGGIPEIIENDKSGILIPIKDADSLFVAMKSLYENPAEQNTLGLAARERFLEKYQLDKIVERDFIPLIKGDIK